MAKSAFPVILMLLFASALFAADVVSYVNSNGLEVTRTLEVNKSARISESTGTVVYLYSSTLTLAVRNAGPLGRYDLIISQKLPSLPEGAKVAYTPGTTSIGKDGRTTWEVGELDSNETVRIVALIDAEVGKDWLASLGAPEISVGQINAVLTAAKNVNVGENVDVTLATEDGIAIPGAKVTAISPSGRKIEMLTDANGGASYKATEPGNYLYAVEAYAVRDAPETAAKPLIVSPPITASVEPAPAEASLLSNFTLVIAGFMLVSLVLLGVIAYYSMKGEEQPKAPPAARKEEREEKPERREAPAPKKEEQKSAFKDEADRVQKAREMTKRILEARKKELEAKKKKR